MASLLIEGDPGAIRNLLDELLERHYLGSDFYHQVFHWDVLTVAQEIEAVMQKADEERE